MGRSAHQLGAELGLPDPTFNVLARRWHITIELIGSFALFGHTAAVDKRTETSARSRMHPHALTLVYTIAFLTASPGLTIHLTLV